MLARVSLKADTKATAKNIFVTTENLFMRSFCIDKIQS